LSWVGFTITYCNIWCNRCLSPLMLWVWLPPRVRYSVFFVS
jgi:hypothetical protein